MPTRGSALSARRPLPNLGGAPSVLGVGAPTSLGGVSNESGLETSRVETEDSQAISGFEDCKHQPPWDGLGKEPTLAASQTSGHAFVVIEPFTPTLPNDSYASQTSGHAFVGIEPFTPTLPNDPEDELLQLAIVIN